MDRRTLLLAAGATAGANIAASTALAADAPSLTGPYLDLTTGVGNMLARARMDGNIDESKEKFGSATGIVSAVRPGEAVRDLFGCEVFSAGRIRRQTDGSFHFLHRETIYYTDLVSGEHCQTNGTGSALSDRRARFWAARVVGIDKSGGEGGSRALSQ